MIVSAAAKTGPGEEYDSLETCVKELGEGLENLLHMVDRGLSGEPLQTPRQKCSVPKDRRFLRDNLVAGKRLAQTQSIDVGVMRSGPLLRGTDAHVRTQTVARPARDRSPPNWSKRDAKKKSPSPSPTLLRYNRMQRSASADPDRQVRRELGVPLHGVGGPPTYEKSQAVTGGKPKRAHATASPPASRNVLKNGLVGAKKSGNNLNHTRNAGRGTPTLSPTTAPVPACVNEIPGVASEVKSAAAHGNRWQLLAAEPHTNAISGKTHSLTLLGVHRDAKPFLEGRRSNPPVLDKRAAAAGEDSGSGLSSKVGAPADSDHAANERGPFMREGKSLSPGPRNAASKISASKLPQALTRTQSGTQTSPPPNIHDIISAQKKKADEKRKQSPAPPCSLTPTAQPLPTSVDLLSRGNGESTSSPSPPASEPPQRLPSKASKIPKLSLGNVMEKKKSDPTFTYESYLTLVTGETDISAAHDIPFPLPGRLRFSFGDMIFRITRGLPK
ncbi:hypothetical protein DIPPA_28474 [Diplonema papillatum]|nr:hypothetical protein DIPPA_28474 [Diplonema papillatum]